MNKKNLESGRSMVEMLGTLAIMGVLSVAAIAGFNYAMNKHRSNEILDEARKRAYTVMTQIQLGQRQTLSEYNRNNAFAGGTFGSEIVTEGLTGQFGLQVTGVLGRVCNNLKDTVSPNTIIRKIKVNGTDDGDCNAENNALILVYNNDLSTNALPVEFTDRNSCTHAGFIYNNGQCANDMCDTCATGQNCLTVSGEKKCVSACPSGTTRDDATGTCTNNKCTDYTNCDKNQYCEFDCGSSQPTSGTCKNISSISTDLSAHFFYSLTGVSYWSAVDLCLSKGRHLVSLEEMNCNLGTNPAYYRCCDQLSECSDPVKDILNISHSQPFWSSSIPEENRRNVLFPGGRFAQATSASLTDWACKIYYALCIE